MADATQTGFGAEMDDITDIETRVSGLSPAALRELQARIDLRLSGGKFTLDTRENAVWDALVDAVGKYTLRPMYLDSFARGFGQARLRSTLFEVNRYIDNSCGDINIPHRRAIARTMFDCLVEYIESWPHHVPIAVRSLLDNVHHLPRAVELCFPGYASAGILHRIVPVAVAA